MSEFEFLSVLISVLFGLALTQIMSGAVRSIYLGEISESQIVYTLFSLIVLILNWWVGFSWNLTSEWTIDVYMIIVFWAMSHYGMAVTMYPPVVAKEWTFERRRRYFLAAFMISAIFDIMVTAARGAVFTPWYYLPFVGHFIVVSAIGVYFDSNRLHRFISWWFLLVILTWAFVVRRNLSALV